MALSHQVSVQQASTPALRHARLSMRIVPRAQHNTSDINPFTIFLLFCFLAFLLCLPHDLEANELRLTLIPLVE